MLKRPESLPSPGALLNLPRFSSWYPGQERVFQQVLAWYRSPSRFLSLSVPAGSGKSLSAILASRLLGARTCILTATKGLQSQYVDDFGSIGLQSVKGRGNFSCALSPHLTAEEGSCNEGLPCPLRSTTCAYYLQLSAALDSSAIITNYSYYLAQTAYSTGLGKIGLLILDEAHLAFNALEGFLSVYLSHMDASSIGVDLSRQEQSWEWWRAWAVASLPRAEAVSHDLELRARRLRSSGEPVPTALSRSLRTARSMVNRLSTLSSALGKWVVQPRGHGWRFTPVWVRDYGDLLYQDAPKVILMSALLSDKTLDILGVPSSQRTTYAAPSPFPPVNTPVYHVPSVRVNQHTDGPGMALWAARIDQYIQRRLDRKGIVFTVSYDRARNFMARSRHKDILYTHSTNDVTAVVERFRRAAPPAVLVSPAVTSGWDFSGDDCRYIVIGKIPYPDTTDPVLRARAEDDKDWPSYCAMETLANESARGSRSVADKCEVAVLDDNWKWYWYRFKQFAPAWFAERVIGSVSTVPEPMV